MDDGTAFDFRPNEDRGELLLGRDHKPTLAIPAHFMEAAEPLQKPKLYQVSNLEGHLQRTEEQTSDIEKL